MDRCNVSMNRQAFYRSVEHVVKLERGGRKVRWPVRRSHVGARQPDGVRHATTCYVMTLGKLMLSLRCSLPGLYVKPRNWSWTVSESGVSSTCESCGFSPVNSVSKFATSSTDSYTACQLPSQLNAHGIVRTTCGLNGGWIFFASSL